MMTASRSTHRRLLLRSGRVLAAASALALVASACGGVGLGAGEEEEQSSAKNVYAQEDVEIIVPFDPGGGTDTTARFLAPLLGEHIAGKPSVQVVNIPAGGGIVGANEFVTREHDGLSMLLTSASNTYPYLLGQEGVRYDYRSFAPTIGVPTGAVIYTSPKTGVANAGDLVGFDKKLYVGGKSPAAIDCVFLLIWDLLDLNVETVFGMESSDDTRVAFERGETNLDWQTTSAYEESVQPMVKSGEAVPLFTVGKLKGDRLVRDPAYPDLPTVAEVYEQIHGKPPAGPMWEAYKKLMAPGFTLQKVLWLHKDAPASAIEAVRQTGPEILKDPMYKKDKASVLGSDDLLVGPTLAEETANTLAIPDETREWMVAYLNKKYDAGL